MATQSNFIAQARDGPLRARSGVRFAALGGPAVVAASLGLNILSLALPVVTLQLYDRVIPNASSETLVVLATGLLGVLVMDAILRLARAHLMSWAGAQTDHALSCEAVQRVLAAPIDVVDPASQGEQLERLSAVEAIRQFYADQGPLILIDLPFALIFIALIGAIGGTLVLVPIGLLAAFALIAWGVGRGLRRALADRSEVDDRRLSFVIEVLANIHSVKALAMEHFMARRYERLADTAAGAAYRVGVLNGTSQAFGALFAQAATLGIVLPGAIMVIETEITLGALAACTLLCGRALQPVMSAMGLWAHFQSVVVARKRHAALLDLPSERASDAPAMPAITGAFRLSGVSYGYAGTAPLYSGVDLDVAAGETVAITGANGSGRSTLLGLIAGALRPTAGTVSFDGIDIAERDVRSLRRQIAYLPQDGALFRGTIMENLTLFRDGPIVDEAIRVALTLGLDEAVARLPEGFDTPVGDTTGYALPGGVRQRIAIARGFIGEHRVVLFDEANNTLDADADERLRTVLKEMKGKRTLVLVSYRPSILRLADRVLAIADGRLIARAPAAAGAAPVGHRGHVA